MNLDDLDSFTRTDTQSMIRHIDGLPDQLAAAWAHALTLDLAPATGQVDRVIIGGMGGSAISGDLLAALVQQTLPLPVSVVRGYDLPASAHGPRALLVALSHSGETEETLSVARQALERGMKVATITTGGTLGTLAADAGGMPCLYSYDSPPRAAVGWLYGMLLGLFTRLGLADFSAEVGEALSCLGQTRDELHAGVPVSRNPAKRMAGQMMGRIPVIWGAGLLAPVARRWKTQINENAKVPAYWEELPELNHNTVVGTEVPRRALEQIIIVQLVSRQYDHPRVRTRQRVTAGLLLQQAIFHDRVRAAGTSRLAQQLSLLQYGDYTSYYLAMGYGMDPTPIPQIDMLKAALSAVENSRP